MSGFIILQRDAQEHPLFHKNADKFYAWVWLLNNACWKPTRIRIKGSTAQMERGELSFSVRFLAESWGWSKSKVDRFLADLRTENMILTRQKSGTTAGQKAGQGQSIITICNYDKYQSPEKGQWDSEFSKVGQQRDKEEQGNNKQKKKPPIVPLAVLPVIPSWLPADRWDAFLEMRRKIKKPPTDEAVRLLIKKLGRWHEAGHDVSEILNASIESNWAGVFEPKGKANDKRNPNSDEPTDPFLRAVIERQTKRSSVDH